jgi:hypothetical protein
MQALDLGIEICYAISRPLLACAKAYILMQKEYIYTLNHDKLFAKEEIFALIFSVLICHPLDLDKLRTCFS